MKLSTHIKRTIDSGNHLEGGDIAMIEHRTLRIMFFDEERGWVVDTIEIDEEAGDSDR